MSESSANSDWQTMWNNFGGGWKMCDYHIAQAGEIFAAQEAGRLTPNAALFELRQIAIERDKCKECKT